MSKFFKFIVHFVVICTILCVVALAAPPFFGITTVVMDNPDIRTNLPMGSVTYAIPVKTEEVTLGTKILVEEDGKTYRYNIISLDLENRTGTVADPTISGSETLTVAVKNYVPKVVITVGMLGYLQVATKSTEGLIILGLAVLFLIILYVLAELWKKTPEEDYEEDGIYLKTEKELRREEKERIRRMKEEDAQFLRDVKERKKQGKKTRQVIKTGGFVSEVFEDDFEPEEEETGRSQKVMAQEAASEAHELLKKEIAATTAEKREASREPSNKKKAKPQMTKRAPKQEKVEYKKLAIPKYTVEQLAAKAKKAGDAPEVMKDDVMDVTLFDYSDIISGEEEEA